MSILKLTKGMISERISEFIEIDKVINTDERWQYDNFIIDLDGKWDNSYVFFSGSEIAGYIICSIKNKESLHIHRLAIKQKYQRKSIGRELINEVFRNADKYIKYITLKVRKDNIIAKRFYEKNNFRNICLMGDNNIYRKDL
ncbi:MAG: GNAT family N-acetyltransferase [Methanosarcina sp.]